MILRFRCAGCDEPFESERVGRNYKRKCMPCTSIAAQRHNAKTYEQRKKLKRENTNAVSGSAN